MKVPKTISIENTFWDWLKENRPEFNNSPSKVIRELLKVNLGPSYSANDSAKKVVAMKIAKLRATLKDVNLELECQLEQMKFLESRKVKKK